MVLEQGRHIVGIQRICLIINNKEKDFLWLISFLFPGSHPGEFRWESLCCCKYPDCCGCCDHGSRLPGVLWRCEGKPLHASVGELSTQIPTSGFPSPLSVRGLAEVDATLTFVWRVWLWKLICLPWEKTDFIHSFIINEYLVCARYCAIWYLGFKRIGIHQGRLTSKQLQGLWPKKGKAKIEEGTFEPEAEVNKALVWVRMWWAVQGERLTVQC